MFHQVEVINLRDDNGNHVQVLRLEDFGDFPKVISTNAGVIFNNDQDAIERLVS
jgi:hypothetical protein